VGIRRSHKNLKEEDGPPVQKAKRRKKEPTGLRMPPSAPPGSDACEVAEHYLAFHENDFYRARSEVKKRSRRVVVGSAVLSGLIAVTGASIGIWNVPQLGIATTAFAGLAGVLAAWDGHFRHRELWIQRSQVLGQLQMLRREFDLSLALGEDRAKLGSWTLERLNGILQGDLETWLEIRHKTSDNDRQIGHGHGG
jgi:hypothetical protein